MEIQTGKEMVDVLPFPTFTNRSHHDLLSKKRTLHPSPLRTSLGAAMPDEF